MKRVLFTIAVALAAALSAPCYAGIPVTSVTGAGFDNLTEAQKAEVLKTIADKVAAGQTAADTAKEAAKVVATSTPAKVNEWIDVGSRIGQAMGGAAKEIGVQVNEFVKTPVGQWTMAIIVWKFMGGVIMHLAGGFLVLMTGMATIAWVAHRRRVVTYTYDPEKKNVLGKPLVTGKTVQPMDDEDVAMVLIGTAVIIIVTLVTVFSY